MRWYIASELVKIRIWIVKFGVIELLIVIARIIFFILRRLKLVIIAISRLNIRGVCYKPLICRALRIYWSAIGIIRIVVFLIKIFIRIVWFRMIVIRGGIVSSVLMARWIRWLIIVRSWLIILEIIVVVLVNFLIAASFIFIIVILVRYHSAFILIIIWVTIGLILMIVYIGFPLRVHKIIIGSFLKNVFRLGFNHWLFYYLCRIRSYTFSYINYFLAYLSNIWLLWTGWFIFIWSWSRIIICFIFMRFKLFLIINWCWFLSFCVVFNHINHLLFFKFLVVFG